MYCILTYKQRSYNKKYTNRGGITVYYYMQCDKIDRNR